MSQIQMLGLLTHNVPKVRTLAAVALFDREDPTVLPALVNLCDDCSTTFEGHPEISANFLKVSGIGLPAKKQTVGDITKRMVAFYMQPSGFHYGLEHRNQPGFTEYWEARKNRSHCAAWFSVQLARASQGSSSTQKDNINRIRTVREGIEKLPSSERTWTLLWLYGESRGNELVTEDELVQMCKSLGPGNLLLMLQNKIPSDDPDLQPRSNNNGPYRRMLLFVLRHAGQLLRHSDSDALLACERWQRDYQKHGIGDPTITSWWAVAAARLKPTNASQILHAAMDRFQEEFDSDHRARLCVAMWQQCNTSEMEFVVNWFYNNRPERGSVPFSRGSFIEAIGKEPDGREIVSQLIRDKRLVRIDWQSLERLVRVVSAWTGTPIVTEEEIGKAWHPLGQGHYHWGKGRSKKDYPKETEELESHLSEWRKRLRMSIPKLLDSTIEEKKEIAEQSVPANVYKPRR